MTTDQKKFELADDFLQLARTALTGRQQDIQLLIHRATKRFKFLYPDLAEALLALLQESPTRSSPLRKHSEAPLPVDLDSRLQLLRVERSNLDHEPIFSDEMSMTLNQVLTERKSSHVLLKHGLQPTKSMLFTGPPGVGKTMAAKWIASKLGRPLLVLDLAAVMSSFLGRTGNNIRFVLDYAKNTECVLLLDELDAIAKRRDDSSEIGELKRLVTVLLQEIDDWPSSGLLIAATNHPDLLDPAVWRRFEIVLKFANPDSLKIQQLTEVLLKPHMEDYSVWSKVLSYVFAGKSFSEVERLINLARKSSALDGKPLQEKISNYIYHNEFLTHDQKIALACELINNGILSQRRVQEITGIARETIRKYTQKAS